MPAHACSGPLATRSVERCDWRRRSAWAAIGPLIGPVNRRAQSRWPSQLQCSTPIMCCLLFRERSTNSTARAFKTTETINLLLELSCASLLNISLLDMSWALLKITNTAKHWAPKFLWMQELLKAALCELTQKKSVPSRKYFSKQKNREYLDKVRFTKEDSWEMREKQRELGEKCSLWKRRR